MSRILDDIDAPPPSPALQAVIDETRRRIAACFSGRRYPARLKRNDGR